MLMGCVKQNVKGNAAATCQRIDKLLAKKTKQVESSITENDNISTPSIPSVNSSEFCVCCSYEIIKLSTLQLVISLL